MTDPDARGIVYLVGSGPGDPALLTVKARRLVRTADLVLHDALPGPEILDEIPREKREDVGKRPDGKSTSQSAINDRLVELARAGRTVVRLKGGDPFVFGRGGEEMAHLAANGIHFEVVPGVTSAIAAPGVAGIPATHRNHASSVTIVTGHEDPDKEESSVDWSAVAALGGTIVVLMGVRRLPAYSAALLEAGLDPDTPIAMVERATWAEQSVATGRLANAVDVRDRAEITAPAVVVIGSVASSRDQVREFLANERQAFGSDGNG